MSLWRGLQGAPGSQSGQGPLGIYLVLGPFGASVKKWTGHFLATFGVGSVYGTGDPKSEPRGGLLSGSAFLMFSLASFIVRRRQVVGSGVF